LVIITRSLLNWVWLRVVLAAGGAGRRYRSKKGVEGRCPFGGALMQRIRVLVADPADLARQGLSGLLSAQNDLEVVAAAKTVDGVVKQSTALSPDVVVLGYGFPEAERLDATRHIAKSQPWTPILVLTDRLELDSFLAVVRAGAQGYLGGDIDGVRLIEAVRMLSAGGSVVDHNITKDLFAYVGSRSSGVVGANSRSSAGSPMSRLTPREQEVLRLIAQGRANKEIGALLGISVGTAKTHVRHIFRKLRVSDRTGAVMTALEIDPGRIISAA
jgi:DNA-binding NarL/FixJ family response regulator